MSAKNRIARDPVCGMKVDEQNPRGTNEYEGRTSYLALQAARGPSRRTPRNVRCSRGAGPRRPAVLPHGTVVKSACMHIEVWTAGVYSGMR
jgi:YHS domain-containing protein